MDIDGPPAGFAGPAFPLGFHKRPDAVLFNRSKIVEHAHVVFRTVPLVEPLEPVARELSAVMMVPAMHVFAGKNGAVPSAHTVR
jgi:hypothetical protein